MIRRNSTTIDIDALERRVRELSATIDGDAMARARVADPAVYDAYVSARVAFLRELLTAVEQRADLAHERATRRTAVPPRLERLGPIGAALLAGYNYLFKTQREIDHEQTMALRSLTVAVGVTLDLVVASSDPARGDLPSE